MFNRSFLGAVVVAAATLMAVCPSASNPLLRSRPTGSRSLHTTEHVLPSVTLPGGPHFHSNRTFVPDLGNVKTTLWVADTAGGSLYKCRVNVGGANQSPDVPDAQPTGNCKIPYPSGEITGEAEFDWHGLLYVANPVLDEVDVLDVKSGATVAIIADPDQVPSGVAIARDGTVAVTNIASAGSSGPATINFYAAGSFKKKKTIVGSPGQEFFFGGFDKHGNFYNDSLTTSGGVEVGVVDKGSTKNSDTGYGSKIGYPGGIQVAKNGSINILDQACPCLKSFTGAKLKTVTLQGASDPITLSFNSDDSQVWTADYGLSAVEGYAFPSGQLLASLGGFAGPEGIAVVTEGSP